MPSPLKDAVKEYLQSKGGGDGVFFTPIGALAMMQSSTKTMPSHRVYRPSLCIIVQGAKQIMLGEQVVEYHEMQSLIVSIELPGLGRVIKASPEEPFIGMTLEFDVGLMREVMEQLETPPKPSGTSLGIFVNDLDDSLADCILRLIRLLATPKAIPILYPAIMREICFWLLTGVNGSEICKLALPDGHTQRIANAIYVLREEFARPIRIERLAAAAGMSLSSFHEHFKLLTSLTPLQYQKHLRLIEARRLLVSEAASVADAAHRVGYESASQFSREYARMFGAPPRRDASELRGVAA